MKSSCRGPRRRSVRVVPGRRCHVNREVDAQILVRQFSGSCARCFPGVKRVASKLLEGSSREQVTLKVEDVVDSGLNIQKVLCRVGRLETLLFALSSSDRLV